MPKSSNKDKKTGHTNSARTNSVPEATASNVTKSQVSQEADMFLGSMIRDCVREHMHKLMCAVPWEPLQPSQTSQVTQVTPPSSVTGSEKEESLNYLMALLWPVD